MADTINKPYVPDALAESYFIHKEKGVWKAEVETSWNGGNRTVRKNVFQKELSGAELTAVLAVLQGFSDKATAKVEAEDFDDR